MMDFSSQNKKIKGVIVAAGYGTRFLPATKTIPKELFPIIDRPAIDFIIEEFVQSGITDILVISSRRKKSLEDFFDHEIELESVFDKEHNAVKMAKIAPAKINIFFTRQKAMLGTGHAIYQARTFTENNAFVVAYPDDLFFGGKPVTRQLIDLHRETGKNILAVKDLKEEDISRYAALRTSGSQMSGDKPYHNVSEIVEKPAPGTEPSKLTSFGRYLFTPDFFIEMEPLIAAHQQGELYHIGAINALAQQGKMLGLEYAGERYDTGEPLGYLQTQIRYALDNDSMREPLLAYLRKVVQ